MPAFAGFTVDLIQVLREVCTNTQYVQCCNVAIISFTVFG